jgi:hypothetical protein
MWCAVCSIPEVLTVFEFDALYTLVSEIEYLVTRTLETCWEFGMKSNSDFPKIALAFG